MEMFDTLFLCVDLVACQKLWVFTAKKGSPSESERTAMSVRIGEITNE